MARYSYRASDAGGRIITGVRETQSRAEVLAWLIGQQLVPLDLIEEKSAALSGVPSGSGEYLAATSETGARQAEQAVSMAAFVNPMAGKKAAPKMRNAKKEVLAFTQQMAGLLSAGTPIDRALAILQDLLGAEAMGLVVTRIRNDVQEGASFSDALACHPKLFNPYYLNIIKAGEAGGVLPLILKRLAGVLEEEEAVHALTPLSESEILGFGCVLSITCGLSPVTHHNIRLVFCSNPLFEVCEWYYLVVNN